MSIARRQSPSGGCGALLDQARRSGGDRRVDLRSGARISVRVRDGWIWMMFARCAKPVGDVDLATFRAQCGVPATARRIPGDGQQEHRDADGRVWHRVGWTWHDKG